MDCPIRVPTNPDIRPAAAIQAHVLSRSALDIAQVLTAGPVFNLAGGGPREGGLSG